MSSKKTDMTHGTEKTGEKAKGKDNFISNVFIIAFLVLCFVLAYVIIYTRSPMYILLVFFSLLGLLMLYTPIKTFFEPSRPKKHKELDNKMMCKKGHIVSVYVNYDRGIPKGQHNLDVTCGASVWPEKCPICGASWLRPGK